MRLTEDEIVASLPPWYTQVGSFSWIAAGRAVCSCAVFMLPWLAQGGFMSPVDLIVRSSTVWRT